MRKNSVNLIVEWGSPLQDGQKTHVVMNMIPGAPRARMRDGNFPEVLLTDTAKKCADQRHGRDKAFRVPRLGVIQAAGPLAQTI